MNLPDAPTPQPQRRAMGLVFLVIVVDLLGFGIVLPLLPLTGDDYVRALIPGPEAERWTGPVIGLLMAVFSMVQFVFAPIWGRLSDHVGRRPVILVGLIGSVAFYSLFGIAAALPPDQALLALILLFLSRFGAGLAGATISTAQAIIADSTPPDKRKSGMAVIGAAFGIAFTFGPLLGALALAFAPSPRLATSYTGYAAAGLSLIALILAAALLPETRKPGAEPAGRRRIFDLHAWRQVLTSPALAPIVLTAFLATLGFGAFETTLALLIRDSLHLAKSKTYLVFAYVGLVLALTQGGLYRRLAPKSSEVALMAAGIATMGLGVLLLAGVTLMGYMQQGYLDAIGAVAGGLGIYELTPPMYGWRLGILLVALAVAVIGFAFLNPSAQGLFSRRAPADKQGEYLGVSQSAQSLARIVGPIFGLTLYKLTSSHMLPYLFGAALLFLMLPLIPRIRRAETKTEG